MAQFNLNDYETVEERIRRLYATHPDARVITHNLTTREDREVSMWVVKAEIWLSIWNNVDAGIPVEVVNKWLELGESWYLKATGHAFEVDGMNGMANKTSALENCETSAIGRALANMNLSGNKRASREEMSKVVQAQSQAVERDWTALIVELHTVEAARKLYQEARSAKAPTNVLDAIKQKASSLG